jgi:hypothetical protein
MANRVCRQKRERLGLTAAAYLERHGPWRSDGEEPPLLQKVSLISHCQKACGIACSGG